MLKNKITAVMIASAMIASMLPHASAQSAELSETLPYQNTELSFEERAADLVSRMTLEEKVAQTGRTAPAIARLGVPKYNYWREGIHGVARQGQATSFPSSLAMSNTWDTELMREAMDITSTEARAKNPRYDLSYWNPTINMARDPRWGRNEETYGEDPYLTGQMAIAAVRGMQGDDEKYLKTIATLKHFAANNCEGERQTGTSVMSESTLRDYYTKAFQTAVEAADPMSVMSSYNAITMSRNGETVTDYIASSANKYLLTDVLRRTYGFNGYVVGDCGAWENLFGRQSLRQKLFPDMDIDDITASMAVSAAYNAGNNLDCGSRAQTSGYDAVTEGLTDEETLDRAVYELFLARMRTGEFDAGARYQDITSAELETDAHVAKAEQAAEESWVLLENNGALPLKAGEERKIAVVGALADEVTLGDYSGEPTKTSTPYQGIVNALPDARVDLLGKVSDTTPLFDITGITLVLSDGKTRAVDLSKAQSVKGMDSNFKNVTKSGYAVIPGIDFSNVASVKISAAPLSGAPTASVNIGYSNTTQTVSTVDITGAENTAEYTGATGGYTGTEDMYITVSASAEFSVENYKTALDDADYIIAYAGTTTADSSESHDRSSIDLPTSQMHVEELCNAYPEKTIVVMSTVGQVNVEDIRNKCAAMLWTSYNGQTQGEALGKVLSGDVNPSGRLTTTWYKADDLDKMPIGSPRQQINKVYYNFTNYEIAQSTNYPGRTYQYYNGDAVYPFGFGKSYTEFAYSNVSADKTVTDVNSTVTVTADITNIGAESGTEVVQLYVSAPTADGVNVPLKQLKGFTRVSLDPNETKTVTFELNMADMALFDERTQANYVPTGDYTIAVAENANDTANTVKVNVTGTLDNGIKLVKAIPSGIKLYGADTGAEIKSANTIDSGVSVSLRNDALVTDLSAYSVQYTSSNESVATVDENGIVSAGAEEGTSLITVTVSDGTNTASDSFAVVTQIEDAVSDSEKAEYLAKLDSAYNMYPEAAYEADDYAGLTRIYTEARAVIEAELLADKLPKELADALEQLGAVPRIELEAVYEIKGIEDNRIETAEPVSLKAIKDGAEAGDVVWDIIKLDTSSRRSAQISADGVLTAYETGVYKIMANNYSDKLGGETIVHINLPIKAESADASGAWLRFDGIRIAGLTSVTFNASGTATLRAALSPAEDRTVAEGAAGATADFNRNELAKLVTDESGCASIYVQTNGADLESVRFNYIDSGIDVLNLSGGSIKVSVPYESGYLIEATYDESGRLTGIKSNEITSSGGYELTGYSEGDKVSIMVWDGFDTVRPLTKAVEQTYEKPQIKTLTLFNFSDGAFDSFFETSDGARLTSGTGMDGIGGWQTTTSARSYTYNGKSYTFTRALKGGRGSAATKNVYFTPEADGVITVLFDASPDRMMIAEQGSRKTEQYGAASGVLTPLVMPVNEGERVYIYGGGSNKNLYAVFFDTAAEFEATPEPTATPTPPPTPDTSYTKRVEFEEYSAAWSKKANKAAVSNASGSYVIENTSDGDIFYFGEQSMDKLAVIDMIAGVRDSAGEVTAEVFAAEVSGKDIPSMSSADVTKLLTSETSLGKVGPLGSDPSKWNNFKTNTIVLSSARTGTKGIFVKLNTTGKYCGNIDCIDLKYTD